MQAALHLFSVHGYDGTTIDTIRQAAGFKSKASLYAHFTSKEEIALALHLTIREREDQVIMNAYDAADEDLLSRFLAVLKAYITWCVEYPVESAFCLFRVQQEALMQKKATFMGNYPVPSDLLLLKLISKFATIILCVL